MRPKQVNEAVAASRTAAASQRFMYGPEQLPLQRTLTAARKRPRRRILAEALQRARRRAGP